MYVYIHAHSLSRTGARSTALPAAAGGPCIALAFAEPFCRPCALVCFAILPSLCIVLLLMCARRAPLLPGVTGVLPGVFLRANNLPLQPHRFALLRPMRANNVALQAHRFALVWFGLVWFVTLSFIYLYLFIYFFIFYFLFFIFYYYYYYYY